MAESKYLYHLVPLSQWVECKAANNPYFPPTYEQDGFIHLTKEAHLLLPVANHFYKDFAGVYIVLKIDREKLNSEVKFEPAAAVGNKATTKFEDNPDTDPVLFPHLYGTINFDAVVEELKVERSEDGKFMSIEGL